MAVKASSRELSEAERNAPDLDDDGRFDVEHYPLPDGSAIGDDYLREVWVAATSAEADQTKTKAFAGGAEAAAPDPALWGEVQSIIPPARPAALPHLCGAAGGAAVWLVDGNAVKLRDGQMDFVEGGNGQEDPDLCGPDEIYVDAMLDPSCWAFVAYHEAQERLDMAGGMSYADAHERANQAERQLRAQQVNPT